MLNISNNSVSRFIQQDQYAALRLVNRLRSGNAFKRLIVVSFVLITIILFLPWTQNIRATGSVSTLRPDQRPQTIHSTIAGKIERWFVKEGDYVEKGDTILFISEVKDAYFDPELLQRTEEQVKAKESSARSYDSKVKSLERQIIALEQTQALKLQQARNKQQQSSFKVVSDSMDLEALRINYQIAQEQYKRMEQLQQEGLKSLTELENRRNTLQAAQAKMIAAENKLLSSRNDLLNAQMEINSLQAQYEKDIAKAESEKFTALSSKFDAEANVNKLQNQYMNYSVRKGMYYITAPQNGYVTKALEEGIGRTFKEGAAIVSIMPSDYNLMVQLYVEPIDLPLIQKGQEVRIQFDGWPAIVFSGWPNTSYGTYGGRVFAIDNFISNNGMFRVLVEPDTSDYEWPGSLRVGGGTNNMLLLKEVPIWYELWRQINGFPPDFYRANKQSIISSKEEK